MFIERQLLTTFFAAFLSFGCAVPTSAFESTAWSALKMGAIVLFRHANAPGGGDPSAMRIGDCATLRNLDQIGRDQAKRIGAAFRMKNIAVSKVLASQWCRAMETAHLAFGEPVNEATVFNSFFDDLCKGPEQTRQVLALLSRRAASGSTVVVTHQVNITAITGIFPA